MADFDQQRLIAILADPSETVSIECKGWLDFSDKRNKATLAKAAIALANQGGGTIALGIGEDTLQGNRLVCRKRPPNLHRYSSDDIGSAINTYADPEIDFQLEFVTHPESSAEYAFVDIPGGMKQPVIAKKGYNGVLRKGACYIRKPGPKSEEPKTPQEWRDLFNRCVLANRESMIDAFRGVIDGRLEPGLSRQGDKDLHAEFLHESRDRWHDVTGAMPQHDPALLGKGHFEIAFSILGLEADLVLNDLRKLMQEVATIVPSIWFLFVDFDHGAQPMGNSMEAVYLNPNESLFNARAFYYWRVRDDGRFYLVRSYQEDTVSGYSKLYYTVPIWRIGQALDYAAAVCSLIGIDLEFLFSASYTGLNGRELFDTDNRIDFWPARRTSRAGNETLSLKTVQVSPRQVEDNLAEIVFDLLTPLYMQFSFFELPRDEVSREIQDMRKHVRSRSTSN